MANFYDDLILVLKAVSDVLTAGVAIIAFSLFINSLTYKIRDAVTNTFTVVLFSIVIVFGADAFFTVVKNRDLLLIIVKIHWLGLILLPTAYFLFSDGLLTSTGKPSRGKRRVAGFLFISISFGFSVLLSMDLMIGNLVVDLPPAPFFQRTAFNDLFALFFFGVMGLSWYNFIRTYRRTLTQSSRRRMLYMIISGAGPAIGSFPYLLYGSSFASENQLTFWLLSIFANAIVGLGMIGMAYAVSFYGFPWPDRVIKTRLFRWIMRGPITASLTLGITTLITRIARLYGIDASAIVVLSMVATIVLFEFLVTIFAPVWEKIFFYGDGKQELEQVRAIEERLLTNNDFRQFLELILASVCDRLQISGAYFFSAEFSSSNLEVRTGSGEVLKEQEKKDILNQLSTEEPFSQAIYKGKTILSLTSRNSNQKIQMLGAVVLSGQLPPDLDAEKQKALNSLLERAVLALKDKKEQELLFTTLEMLTPRVSIIQDLLASSRVEQGRFLDGEKKLQPRLMERWVKDALSQIWGGPKLLQNPILQLNVIQYRINQKNETPLNAVRDLLREAAEYLRPDGDRQFTNEWVLFNLVDLKFFEGWKVSDLAKKLALSEADLYRKQRIAVGEITKKIIELESKASQ